MTAYDRLNVFIPLKISVLKSLPSVYIIWRSGLWEMIESWEESGHAWNPKRTEELAFSPTGYRRKKAYWNPERAPSPGTWGSLASRRLRNEHLIFESPRLLQYLYNSSLSYNRAQVISLQNESRYTTPLQHYSWDSQTKSYPEVQQSQDTQSRAHPYSGPPMIPNNYC